MLCALMWPAAKRWIVGAVIGALGVLLAGAGTAWWLGIADPDGADGGALHDVNPGRVLSAGRLPPLPDEAHAHHMWTGGNRDSHLETGVARQLHKGFPLRVAGESGLAVASVTGRPR